MARKKGARVTPTKYKRGNLTGSLTSKHGWDASRGRNDLTVNERLIDAIKYTGWDTPRKRLAEEYADALIFGNGQPPKNLSSGNRVTVQQYFTRICLNLQLNDGVLPGQQEPWYEKCKKDVKDLKLPRHPRLVRRR